LICRAAISTVFLHKGVSFDMTSAPCRSASFS
jgi:hypothetical protein